MREAVSVMWCYMNAQEERSNERYLACEMKKVVVGREKKEKGKETRTKGMYEME